MILSIMAISVMLVILGFAVDDLRNRIERIEKRR